jgi:hypothetical protein
MVAPSKVTPIRYLQIGDFVRARQLDGSHEHHGEIDDISHKHCVLWIRQAPLGDRILIETSRYEITKPKASNASMY